MGYRELGLLSILLMWGAFAFLFYKWRGKTSMSISKHAASAWSAFSFFAAVLVLSGTLFSVFMLKWFIPQLQLDGNFLSLFYFTMFCFYLTALTPEIKGKLKQIHRFFAYTLAFMLFVTIVYSLFFAKLNIVAQCTAGAAVLYMIFCMVSYLFVWKIPEHHIMKNYVRYQTMYIVSFQIFILVATYLR